jgi:DNA replication and repair protein RecF
VSALAVTRLRLSQFRSHRTLDLTLDGRPLALVGPNGAGKTNLIEAVSLLSPGRGLRGAAADEMAGSPKRLGWRIAADIVAPDGAHEIETRSEGGGRTVRIDGKPAPQTGLGRVARVLWLTPAMDRIWTDAAGDRRRFLDRIAMSLIPDHADVALGYDKALRERNRLIRDDVRDAAWFDALEGRMAEFGARLGANRLSALARIGAVAPVADFPVAELALEGGAPRDAGPLAAALREGRGRDRAAGRSLTGPHRDDLAAVYAAKGVPARLCSTGEQKALLVSLVLANTRAVAEAFGAPPILLLDEVAAHLDAGRRAALYDEICALGAQAFMTGTGAELFAELGARAQHLRVSETDGVSDCGWEVE